MYHIIKINFLLFSFLFFSIWNLSSEKKHYIRKFSNDHQIIKAKSIITDTLNRPDENRFTKVILSNDLNEPMEMAIAPDGRVFFIERAGKFYVYDPVKKKTRLLYDFPVKAVDKYLNGLLGMTIDPKFNQNHYLYFFYTIEDKDHLKQRISRIIISDDNILDLASEKSIIEFPIDKEVSAHTGGSMTWDANGNLFISTGDNTVPFESNGFAPIDERTGRLTFDAQRSAGNPNDLRGKILRIHPHDDGSYTIPEGNLFAKGTTDNNGLFTRPEIYIMGCRNPYRISVDLATSILYWGEIGPDSGTDGVQGPRGYDEFNQARIAGNFGWPYFVGDNKPYNNYDFSTKNVGSPFDALSPVNNSINNTGIKKLPPAQKPLIWYPYDKSNEFPYLGVGGRCAMGGPVYHFNQEITSTSKLPFYYDKALFVYDWMRNWVFAVRLDQSQNFQYLERFMPLTGDFRRPIDMEIGQDGNMYILEYGSVYGIDNEDARLVKIEYNGGNRTPVAVASASKMIGLAPLTIKFTGDKSHDFDKNDQIKYEWHFDTNSLASNETNPTYTFNKNGIYKVVLKVSDQSDKYSTDTLTIKVGNTEPQVAITTPQNKTFFFPNPTPLNYSVIVKDKEDKIIDKNNLKVVLNYLSKVNNEPFQGHQQISPTFNLGKTLIANSDCKACHQLADKSVGPSFTSVAKRYSGDKTATAKLANKVIIGGGGVWGAHTMSAHPQLSREEATEMVKYILSIGSQPSEISIPQQGNLLLKEHLNNENQGRYFLTATYIDKGPVTLKNGMAVSGLSLSKTETLMLRPTKVYGSEADELYNMKRKGKLLISIQDHSFFVLKGIDLKGINKITYKYSSKNLGGEIEIHSDSLSGSIISKIEYQATGNWEKFSEINSNIKDINTLQKHSLYFVIINNKSLKHDILDLEYILFQNK